MRHDMQQARRWSTDPRPIADILREIAPRGQERQRQP
jgi:hypothetical protein